MKQLHLLAFCACAIPAIALAQPKYHYVAIAPNSTMQDIITKVANVVPTAKQLRWQQLELTAFFHFGINTFTNKEWGNGKEDPILFNPKQLDAEQWIQTVKAAGIKQVILTAKHHDGFCLWPTKTTSHSVAASPWLGGKGDVVKAVADACKKYNIGFGVYLSPWDRNAPSYGSDAYNTFFTQQLTELLTQYGKIDEVWFDGANGEGPNGKKQVYNFMQWYSIIRQLQPQAVIAIMGPDVRWVGTESGKGRTTEWSVVPANNMDLSQIAKHSQQDAIFKPKSDMMGEDLGSRNIIASATGLVWYPAETDVSIRPGWFYHSAEDSLVKTPQQLMDIYYTSVGMNSVLLLNIPPNTQGRISPVDSVHLKQFGKLVQHTFTNNLAKGAKISCANGSNTTALIDGQYHTYFTTKGKDTTTTITFNLPKSIICNVVALQENIAVGQRVESFTVEYLDSRNQWLKAASGTTIGYKRLLQMPNIAAKQFRLTIQSSRSNPAIAEFGLYKSP